MALEESVLNDQVIARILLNDYGLHLLDVHVISFGTANCFKITCSEGSYFLKEYQSWFTLEDIEREAHIVEFLTVKKYPTALFLKTLEGKFGIWQSGHVIGVQEFIEGDTYTNKLPHTMLIESAAYLGKLHNILKEYPMKKSMDEQWVKGFSANEASARCDELLDILEDNKSDKYYERIRNDLIYKKELNMKLENMKSYFCGITYSSSHGDYTACQLIGEHGKIKAVIDAVIREMKEETGLLIQKPHLCGVKQFPIDGGRYIVFLFETDQFEGELADSEEGKMHWIKDSDLSNVNLVNDFEELIEVMLNDSLTEFQYVIENDEWIVVKK